MNSQKRKGHVLEEEISQIKFVYDKRKNELVHHLNEKDFIIEELRRELTEFKNTNFTSIMQQSPIANNSMTPSKDFEFNVLAG